MAWYTYCKQKGCDNMLTASVKKTVDTVDSSKGELYQLIEEGFQAIREGRVCTIEEVKEELNKMRVELG